MTPPTPGLSFDEALDALQDAYADFDRNPTAERSADYDDARAAVVQLYEASIRSEATLFTELAAERQRAEGLRAALNRIAGFDPWELRDFATGVARAALTPTGPVGGGG